MEFFISYNEPFPVEPFSNVTHVYPNNCSFLLCVGISLFELLFRSDSHNELLENIRKEMKLIQSKTMNSKDFHDSFGLITQLISNIKNQTLDQFYKDCLIDSNVLRSIYNIMFLILNTKLKLKNQFEYEFSREHLTYFNSRFKVFIYIFSSEPPIVSKIVSEKNLIFLLKSRESGSEGFSILHHKQIIQDLEQGNTPKKVFPYYYDPNALDGFVVSEDFFEIKAPAQKFISESHVSDEEMPDQASNQIEFMKILVSDLSEIMIEHELTSEEITDVLDLYRQVDCNIPSLEQLKTKFVNLETLKDSKVTIEGNFICCTCDQDLRLAVQILCPSHKQCIDCRLTRYKATNLLFCEVCSREYTDKEIRILKYYYD